MISPLVPEASNQARNDEVGRCHSDGSGDEDGLSAESIDPEHGGDGEEELEDADHAGRKQGRCVCSEVQVLEDEGPGMM